VSLELADSASSLFEILVRFARAFFFFRSFFFFSFLAVFSFPFFPLRFSFLFPFVFLFLALSLPSI
jgi:hypothetical protein